MRSPSIDLHGFPVSRQKLGVHYRSFFVSMAVFLVGMTLWNGLTGDWPSGRAVTLLLLGTAGLLACLAGVLWVLYRRQWKREGNLDAALFIGPDGIHDRRRWKRPIPWSRIKAVRPMSQDPQKYKTFKIEIEGRNDISRSGLERLFDNWLVHPMGGDPGFTVSFLAIDTDDHEVAALVKKIVVAAES